MDSPDSTKLCTKPWCKQHIPANSTFKNCAHCREHDRKNQQARRIKIKETTDTEARDHSAGHKRRLDQDQDQDRPSCRRKIQKNQDSDGETESEDEFEAGGIEDITEPDESVSI